jgi:hypothetical protein
MRDIGACLDQKNGYRSFLKKIRMSDFHIENLCSNNVPKLI